MSTTTSLLLRGGTVLLHGANDRVDAVETDILIVDSKIARIERSITAPGAHIIDCSDTIVSPGFIDTHHHVWQTQFRGVHADQSLVQFAASGTSGNFAGKVFTPEDVFWGQLAGCMEMIDVGTTTVVDYTHVNPLQEYGDLGVAATVASGVRSVFCHYAMATISDWTEMRPDYDRLHTHVETLEHLIRSGPHGDGRVTIGFAFDGWQFAPEKLVAMLRQRLQDLEIPLITCHYWWRDGDGARPTGLDTMVQRNVVDGRWLISHASNAPPDDVALMKQHNVHISSSPSTELQFSMGFPVMAFRTDSNLQTKSSLGVDCQSITSAYIPGEARIGLQSARAARGEVWLQQGKAVRDVGYTVEEAFNLATVNGARAIKRESELGSIAVGKLADLTLFKKDSPSMVCGSVQDPVAAIILNSSPADVHTVIVSGIVRKRNGKLRPIALDSYGEKVAGRQQLEWDEVASALLKSKAAIDARIQALDMSSEVKKAEKLYLGSPDTVIVDVP